MKNLKHFVLITLVGTFICCQTDKNKSVLIGNWFYESPTTGFFHWNITFDSIRTKDTFGHHTAEWNLTENRLLLKNITGDSFEKDKVEYEFKLNDNKTEFFLSVNSAESKIKFENFIKANDSISFVNRNID